MEGDVPASRFDPWRSIAGVRPRADSIVILATSLLYKREHYDVGDGQDVYCSSKTGSQ